MQETRIDSKLSTHPARLHSDSLVCQQCGKSATIAWADISRVRHAAPEPAGSDGSFLERLGKTPPFPIELVCRSCGGVAMTAFPSTSLHDRRKYN